MGRAEEDDYVTDKYRKPYNSEEVDDGTKVQYRDMGVL